MTVNIFPAELQSYADELMFQIEALAEHPSVPLSCAKLKL